MISESNSCFPNVSKGLQMYEVTEDVVSSSLKVSSSSETHSNSLLYGLTLLKDRVHQVQLLVSILISADQGQQPESTSITIANMGTTIQEIIVTASSMMFTCQQMAGGSNSGNANAINHELHPIPGKVDQETVLSTQQSFSANRLGTTNIGQERAQSFYSSETLDWFGGDSYNTCNTNDSNQGTQVNIVERIGNPRCVNENFSETFQAKSPSNCDIIELDATDLLAKYTHYCQVCGKGFKRDANLRMHMRAHGDEYKTSAALSNPMKKHGRTGNGETDPSDSMKFPRKYSCPQEGCRWNQKHAKFQPLKSMICVKNHYKRSHCPKMYVCKRCNRKHFSVLSDLRTHEKHCGDLKWQCSCGTTFSRKDKLMGHVALFVGHTPAINSIPKPAKVENHGMQQTQIDDR